jgi:cysteine synthase
MHATRHGRRQHCRLADRRGPPEHGGQTIVTFLCDTGERYVSSELFQNVRDTV